MSEVAFLLDAPGSVVQRMQVAQLGDGFKDPRYGEFSITYDEAMEWKKNLSELPGGRALIDEDHRADKPGPHRNTEASGWITNLDVDLDSHVVMGDVEWTPKGESAIEEQRYLFFSPAFGKYQNERGEVFENTLTGGALTNKPFLSKMPMITLASAPRLLEAARQEAEGNEPVFTLDQAYEGGMTILAISDELRKKHAVVVKQIEGKTVHMFPIPPGDKKHARAALQLLPAAIKAGHINAKEASAVRTRANSVLGKKEMSDSQSQMQFDANSLKLLGINDEGRQSKILEIAGAEDVTAEDVARAITEAQAAEAGGANGEVAKTLEQQAADEGKVVLDASAFAEILSKKGTPAEGGGDKPALEVTPEMLTTLGIEDEDTQKKLLEIAGESDTDFLKLFGAFEAAKGANKTLEQQAADEGKVLLDSAQVAQLVTDAKAGAEAKKELDQNVFDQAWDRNASAGKVVPAQRKQMESFYQLDRAGTIKLMDDAQPILTTKAAGANVTPRDENIPEGVHEEGYETDQKVRTYMQENKENDYIKALEAVTHVTVRS